MIVTNRKTCCIIFIVTVALAGFVTSVSHAGENKETVLFEEDFNDGALPAEIMTWSAKSKDVKIVNRKGRKDKCLRLYGSPENMNSSGIHKLLSKGPPLDIEFDVKNGDEAFNKDAQFVRGMVYLFPAGNRKNRNYLLAFRGDHYMHFARRKKKEFEWESGKWYHVKMHFKMHEKTCRISINVNNEGTCSLEYPAERFIRNWTNVNIAFSSGSGTTWFDNIRVSYRAPEKSGNDPEKETPPITGKPKKGKLLFSDNFTKPKKSWQIIEGEDCFKKGYFLFKSEKRAPRYCCYCKDAEPANIWIETELKYFGKTRGAAAGFFFSMQPDFSHYYFAVSIDGKYGVWKISRNRKTDLTGKDTSGKTETVPCVPCKYLKKGRKKKNHIAVASFGPKLYFYINNHLVFEKEDKSLRKGTSALAVAPGGYLYAFDNFKVFEVTADAKKEK